MAEFYPSEIARLVLGYLKEIHCDKSWQIFLEECADLQEHKRLYNDGKFCSTNVNGKSLLEILSEYCSLKNASKESSQNNCSTNTYQVYGVYKTPSKNENAYATYSINQRIQTRSILSATKSPRYNLFRSPTSRSSCQTPRRKLDCQSTTLNFGPEAQTPSKNDISNNSANKCKQFLFISASSNTQVCNSSPQVSKDNMCFSSPGLFTYSERQERTEGPYSDPISNKNAVNKNFFPYNQQQTFESNSQNPNAPVVTQSNDTLEGTSHENSGLNVDKQKSSAATTCDTIITQSSVRSVVCRSSEITSNTENLSLNFTENCSTPQYETEPPPYNRAPDTNSPRIVLSHDRSLIPSLTTPNKDKKSWHEEEWSPKRKGTIPRRRLLAESPNAKSIQQPETMIQFDSVIENLFGPDEALFNDPLVQLLTENINKVKQSGELREPSLIEGLDDVVKKVAETTEEELERFLFQMCGNNKDGVDQFNADPSPSKLTDNDNEKRPSEQTFKQKELTFQKLSDVDHKSVSDKNICDEKERKNETENDASSHNATQNFVNHEELESEKIVTEETRNSSKEISDESSNILKNKLDSSIINSDINHEIATCSQQVLEANVNNQLNNISKNSSPDDETDASDNVKQMNNLTSTNNKSDTAHSENKKSNFDSNLSANDNSEKNLQPEEASSVITVDTDMSTSNIVTNDVLSDANRNNYDETRKIDDITQDNQNVKFLAPSMLQTNNSSYIISSPGVQSASAIQMNGSHNVVPQLVPQPASQANAVLEVPLPTLPAIFVPTLGPDGTVQGNLYRFIINTPVFSPAPGCGIGVPLSTVPAQSVASPVTSTPTVPVKNISNKSTTLKKPEESFIDALEKSRTAIVDIASSDKEITSKEATPNKPKKGQKKQPRTSKRKKAHVSYEENLASSPSPLASAKSKKRKFSKRSAKRKPLCLFPDSPASKIDKTSFQTPIKDSDDGIPVISIPSPAGQSSAFKYLSQITGQIEGGDKSPALKNLMAKAAVLSDRKARCDSSYVRCLDFTSESNVQDNTNDSVNNTPEPNVQNKICDSVNSTKTVEPAVDKPKNLARRSSRVKLQKAEMLKDSKVAKSMNVHQLKKKLNVDSVAVDLLANQAKNTELDDLNSSAFSKALDVFNSVDPAISFDDDIDLEHSDLKENSHVSSNLSSVPSIPKKVVKSFDTNHKEAEVVELSNSNNSKENINMLSSSSEKHNSSIISYTNTTNSQINEKEKVKNIDNKSQNGGNISNMLDNKKNNITKKPPLQNKTKMLSTLNSSNSCNSSPSCKKSEVSEKSPNNTHKNRDIVTSENDSNVVNKSIGQESQVHNLTKLNLFLFGSDNEFTPEKDSNSATQTPGIIISSPSITTISASNHNIKQTETGQSAAESTNHASERKKVSPKVTSTPKSNNNKFSSPTKICLTSKTSLNIENENKRNSKLLNSSKNTSSIQNTDLSDIKTKGHCTGEKLKQTYVKISGQNKDESLFKTKTPQKKSLESIISFCKEKERAANKSEQKANHVICKDKQLENLPVSVTQIVEKSVNISLLDGKNREFDKLTSGRINDLPAKTDIFSESSITKDKNNSFESSKVKSTETEKVLPPPKKRIRPIPVDSSSNESFSSPFTSFLCTSNIRKSTCAVSAENATEKEVFIQSNLNISESKLSNIIKEKSEERNNVPVADSTLIYTNNSSNNFDTIDKPISKSSPTNFMTSSKSHTSASKSDSPLLKMKSKPLSSSPKSVSPSPVFKQPSFWRSGKPRAMAEIYKNAFPNKDSELPVSPASFSNSSCTYDAFPAKRKLLEDSLSESSKEVSSSELLKESPKNIVENCDFATDIICNETDIKQGKIIKENNEFEKQKIDYDTIKVSNQKTYSRSPHKKKNPSKISVDNPFDDTYNNNSDLFRIERKRKKSGDSSCSDTCSTVVDFDGDTIMTPIKSYDWLKKDLFKKSPVKSTKTRLDSSSSYESDISPENMDCVMNKTSFSPKKLKEINISSNLMNSKPSKNLSKISHNKMDSSLLNNMSDICSYNNDMNVNECEFVPKNKVVSKVTVETEVIIKKNKLKASYSCSKARKVSSSKKERRSRPTLRITPINSNLNEKGSDKKQNVSDLNSKKSFTRKVVKKESSFTSKTSEHNEKHVKRNVRTTGEYYKDFITCTSYQNPNIEIEKSKNNVNSLEQNTLEKTMKSCATNSQCSVISPKKPVETIDHCETTQDIVESDIGKSSDAGSELAIAIASCERELLNSHSDENSQSPKYQPNFELNTPNKSLSNKEEEKSSSPIKGDSNCSEWNLIMDKIKKLDPDKFSNLLEKITQDKA